MNTLDARKFCDETGMPVVRLCGDAHLSPSWVSRLEIDLQKLDVHSLQDWDCILVYVGTLRDNSDALYDPHTVYRLLTVLGRVPTLGDMKQVCQQHRVRVATKAFLA